MLNETTKLTIAVRMDHVQLLDLLDVDMEELVDILEDRIIDQIELFEEFV